MPPQGRGRPAQFIPVRFAFFNKLTKDDRLLVNGVEKEPAKSVLRKKNAPQ